MLTLVSKGWVESSLVALIFLRDFSLITGGFLHRYRTIQKPFKFPDFFNFGSTTQTQISASNISKFTTAGQISLCIYFLIFFFYFIYLF